MTISLFPVNGTFQGETLRQVLAVFAGAAPAGRPLGAVSGVRPGTPASTVSATGAAWAVAAHVGILDLETPTKAGPYYYVISDAELGSMTPASTSNQRVDSVFVQMSDPTEGDGSGQAGASIGYLAGAPGASGGARGAAGGPPTLPARSLELAKITVPKSGSGSPAVTWVAPAWNGDTEWASSGLPGIGSVANFTLAYQWRIRSGIMFLALAPSRSSGTLTMAGNGTLSDTAFATITGPYAPSDTQLPASYSATHCSGGALWNGTNFVLLDGNPTATISPGDNVRALFVYPIG